MIKKLRVKFICVIMAIVMVMMGIILGVVVHFTSLRRRHTMQVAGGPA